MAYRLEHKKTKLGPYKHNNSEQKSLKYINDMGDINQNVINKIKNKLKNEKLN